MLFARTGGGLLLAEVCPRGVMLLHRKHLARERRRRRRAGPKIETWFSYSRVLGLGVERGHVEQRLSGSGYTASSSSFTQPALRLIVERCRLRSYKSAHVSRDCRWRFLKNCRRPSI
ncbi:hypothetical protein VFPFJ_08584 [Purpureocillium lilacinum]|uniref:Uncharacterized protein n=1 Tax=Purpureocillium lilacinum TaxID=33203 RepID=A0A179GZX4_PURLI|nr:hypothetical protein VFPFJ_08584 [Purpureocillium lilacinum]OAQ82781.1 hypothetical protein VFPFJ_08584 [Purpureocillium lilacinum]